MEDYNLLYSKWNTKDLFDQLYFLQEQTYTTINHYKICEIKSILKLK